MPHEAHDQWRLEALLDETLAAAKAPSVGGKNPFFAAAIKLDEEALARGHRGSLHEALLAWADARSDTRVCASPGCKSAIVRHDDGSRRCAAGHGPRWVDAAEVAQLRGALAEERLRSMLWACKTPPTGWHDRALFPPEFTAVAARGRGGTGFFRDLVVDLDGAGSKGTCVAILTPPWNRAEGSRWKWEGRHRRGPLERVTSLIYGEGSDEDPVRAYWSATAWLEAQAAPHVP